MHDAEIHYVNCFTRDERADYIQQAHIVGLHCHGLSDYKINGREYKRLDGTLSFTPAGSHIEFTSKGNRENWVITFSSDLIRGTEKHDECEVFFNGSWIRIQSHHKIPDEHVSGWRGEFMRMRDAYMNPVPQNQFRVHLGLMNVWRYFVSGEPDRYNMTAAQRLKNLIDEDKNFERSLEQIAINIDYSIDHLRQLFKQEFNMTPKAYRNQRRMAKAMDMVSNSDFNISKIAETCGYEQVSHFSASFRQHFDQSPREAIKKFRT